MEAPTPAPRDLLVAAVLDALKASEDALATNRGELATQLAARALDLLKPWLAATPDEAARRLTARALMLRGNALREQGTAPARATALRAYDDALALLAEFRPGDDPARRNELANLWTNRGIALLQKGAPASLGEAVHCFDQAIELRGALAERGDAWFRYGLAAGWMNRGDALTRLGSPAQLVEAVRSYDASLSVLRGLPTGENPHFHRRLVIAWMNRGITLQAQGFAAALADARRSFDEAITLLTDPRAPASPDRVLLLASGWLNRGNALLGDQTADAGGAAREAAGKALRLVAVSEWSDLLAAEAGLKARHILCQAVARLVAEGRTTGVEADELVTEAAEAVDEGLRLARHWEAAGVTAFRPLAVALFRFGSRVYQTRQPHFLTEFLLENLDPGRSSGAFPGNPEMHAEAMSALWLELGRIQRDGFKALNTSGFDRIVERLGELRVAQARLAELRASHAPAAGPAAPHTGASPSRQPQ